MRTIKGRILFPINGEPIYDGYVVTNDSGEILKIGGRESCPDDAEIYEGIIVPGFVNSHCHIELSHLKGAFEQNTGMAGFIRQINRLRLSVDESERKMLIRKEMEALYNEGVSAMADISNCNESFDCKATSPLYTRSFLEVFGTEEQDCDKIVTGVTGLEKEAKAAGLDAAPTPHSCYTMSNKLLLEVAKLGLAQGFISYHNQESREEEELLISGTGPLAEEYKGRGLTTPPVTGDSALLYFIDTLKKIYPDKAPGRVLLIHNTRTNIRSVRSAMRYFENPHWIICPLSNLFIHRELPPIELLRSEKASIAIGTDSLSSNTILSITEEIKTIEKFFPGIPLGEILQWATLNGARAIGMEKYLGSIEIGKKPGLVLINNIDFVNLKLTENSKSVRLV
jgi:cytosine/adenosine deaminase-related metal-dependent hydrolase